MSINGRIRAFQIVVALTLTAMGAVALANLAASARYREQVQFAREQLASASRLATAANRFSEQIAELLLIGEPERPDFDSARAQLGQALTDLRLITRKAAEGHPAERQGAELERIDRMLVLFRSIDRAVERLLLLDQEGRRDDAIRLFRSDIENRLDAPYLLAVRRRAFLALALALLEPLIAVSLIWIAKSITDTVFVDRQIGLLPLFAGVFLGLSAVKVALEYATTRLEAGVLETILRALRTDLYSHILRLSPASSRAGRSGRDHTVHRRGGQGARPSPGPDRLGSPLLVPDGLQAVRLAREGRRRGADPVRPQPPEHRPPVRGRGRTANSSSSSWTARRSPTSWTATRRDGSASPTRCGSRSISARRWSTCTGGASSTSTSPRPTSSCGGTAVPSWSISAPPAFEGGRAAADASSGRTPTSRRRNACRRRSRRPADVFGFGVLLFELLTGEASLSRRDPRAIRSRRPVDEPARLRAFRPGVPKALDDLVSSCLARDPSDAPASRRSAARPPRSHPQRSAHVARRIPAGSGMMLWADRNPLRPQRSTVTSPRGFEQQMQDQAGIDLALADAALVVHLDLARDLSRLAGAAQALGAGRRQAHPRRAGGGQDGGVVVAGDRRGPTWRR